VVCLSVCHDTTIVIRAKTAEPIEMQFGMLRLSRVGPENHELDGMQMPPRPKAALLGCLANWKSF